MTAYVSAVSIVAGQRCNQPIAGWDAKAVELCHERSFC